ncbi:MULTISPECIES: hypothetical protein [Roseobacteraceae]|uniref:NADH dehydrogenase subunit E n=1 Tax=Pseudosulfitobacter pseudonitzschiae TaxID=1402135 RepID=A0A221K0Y7_9RHOB|nr:MULTISPECIES: hypothetical protein [Roseobacteraceae]ASM72672.1 NADH dehydrogenase subunit E [Pseudosulfitobacter pseudonitzschiae]
MNANEQMQDCTRKCWMLSAIAGMVLAILLIAFTGYGFFTSILFGIVVFVAGGLLLKPVRCGSLASDAPEDADATPSAAPTTTPEPATEAAPVADASAPEAEVATPTPSAAAAAPDEKALVKPSARLAGQEELAARKGDWKYEKPAEASAPAAEVAEPVKKAAAAKAPVSKAADSKDAGAASTTVRAPVAADGKPEMLSAPREGGADDLKLIKGVGPKLESMLNNMGIFHFSQVAGWRKKEVEWADQNLVGFKGRVSRDEWVKQAKVLAKGGSTEFSSRVKKGGVS